MQTVVHVELCTAAAKTGHYVAVHTYLVEGKVSP